jgi:Spondin_N
MPFTLSHRPRLMAPALLLAAIALAAAACGADRTPTAPTAMADVPITPPAAPPPDDPAPPTPTNVRYRVTFEGLWSQQTHPQDYPGNPHFSPLVGATHHAGVRFWYDGGIASDGIKRMAEQGFTSPLDAHINDAIAAGTARTLIRGGGIALSPASTAVEFEAAQSHPLLTLVSMVAPSPDWFVGVSALPLFDTGRWVDRLTLDLRPWDAGTDGGRSYESPDAPLDPRQPIARLTGFPVATAGDVRPMARFVIERLP